MKKLSASLIFTVLLAAGVSAQERGASLTVTGGDGKTAARFTGAHALVIGESAYTHGWSRLAGVKDDVKAVKRLFEEQGFTVETIEDASSRMLKNGIEDFLSKYGYDPNNRLVMYYAGHGHTLTLSGGQEMGYIVPVDAPLPTRDETGFKRNAIAMDQFQSWAVQYESRHIIFIFDSCFSGTVFSASRGSPPVIDEHIARHVRQFITSGAANETVPDKSVFRTQLEAGLRNGEADLDKDGYVSGTELGLFLQNTVVNYSNSTQHPQYGKIRNPNLDKGDFIFEVGKTRPAVITPAVQPVPVVVTPPAPPPVIKATIPIGNITVSSVVAGAVLVGGTETARIQANGIILIENISAGTVDISVKADNGVVYQPQSRTTVIAGQTATASIVWQVGGLGPAGGYLFYDKGHYSNGWRYMEAAPTDASIGVTWGILNHYEEKTKADAGAGKINTELLLNDHSQLGEYDKAAHIASDYNVNGYSDWFLPSFEELRLMYKNLKTKGIGNFSNDWYWSSTDTRDSRSARSIRFSNGSHLDGAKNQYASVRPARFF